MVSLFLDTTAKYFMSLDYLLSQYHKGSQLIFDLDNTLYNERDFLFKAYKEIASTTSLHLHNDILDFLKGTFINEGRSQLFDKLVSQYVNTSLSVAECLTILRNFRCDNCFETYSWFHEFIKNVDSDFKLIIITNGNAQQQKNKTLSINFPMKRDNIEVVYANNFTPKPSPASYIHLLKMKKVNKSIYIGDSDTDQLFCEAAAIEFFDVKKII